MGLDPLVDFGLIFFFFFLVVGVMASGEDEERSVSGTVTSRRRLGKKLCFCTLQPPGPHPPLTLMFKEAYFQHDSSPTSFPSGAQALRDQDSLHATVQLAPPMLSSDDSADVWVVLQWTVLRAQQPSDAPTPARGMGQLFRKRDLKGRQGALCRPWSLGHCPNPRCDFRHQFASDIERNHAEALKSRRENNLHHAAEEMLEYMGEQLQDEDLLPKKARGVALAAFLIQTYTREWLCEGSGVLDVAGGNGCLANALAELGVPCTVVDPYDRREAAKQREKGGRYRQLKEEFNDLFVDHHQELMASVSVLVGLHPDQPTGDICDWGIRLGKPFVVVPCCTYTSLFPDRRLLDGSAVETTNHLVRFIQEKAPEKVRITHLKFEGRNKVLYTLPSVSEVTITNEHTCKSNNDQIITSPND